MTRHQLEGQPKLNSSTEERGIALVLVLAVLAALLTMALPFSWSMRNHRQSADVALRRSQVETDLRAALSLAHGALVHSHPSLDETPYWDDQGELTVDLTELKDAYTFGSEAAKAAKIWSTRVRDTTGLVNIKSASMYLLANLMDLSATLGTKLTNDPATSDLRLVDADSFPPQGILWVGGELIAYEDHQNGRFSGITRAVTTGVYDPPRNPAPREHEAGAIVIDYRVWLLVSYIHEYLPGEMTHPVTIESLRNISRYGEFGFTAQELERIEHLITVDSPWPSRPFTNPQTLIQDVQGGESWTLTVPNGLHYSRGSIVRIKGWDGAVDYRMVVASVPRGDRWGLRLDLPVENDYQRDKATVECLARHPINVNTAPRAVLVAMLTYLQFPGADERSKLIDPAMAEGIADLLIRARPFSGWESLDVFLDDLVERGSLSRTQAQLVYVNGFNSHDASLICPTAPFCFTTSGTYEIETAVSDNFPQSMREKGRLFAEEIVSVAPRGALTATFLSQKDFLDQVRLNRSGRYWTTLPQHLSLYDGNNYPPRENLPDLRFDLDRYASVDERESFALLDSARVSYPPDDPRMIHFDDGQYTTEYPDGWSLDDGPVAPSIDPQGQLARIVDSPQGIDRFQPFGFSLWWKPGSTGGDHALLDVAGTDVENRVLLAYTENALRLRVFDHSMVETMDNGRIEASEWVYEFDDGLPFQADVWYHIEAFVKNNRPDGVMLFVDGVRRGKPSFLTRLSGSLPQINQQGGRLPPPRPIALQDDAGLPSRGVVQVGDELIEYTGSGTSLSVNPEGEIEKRQHDAPGGPLNRVESLSAFGGRGARRTQTPQQPSESAVRLYGYTALLASPDIPSGNLQLGDPIGPFEMARLDYESNQLETINYTAEGGLGGGGEQPRPVGTGITADMDFIPLRGVDGQTPLNQTAFQAGGGFALIVTSRPPGLNFGGRRIRPEDPSGIRVGGAEVVYYRTFNGTALQNVVRGSELSAQGLLPKNLTQSGGGGNQNQGPGRNQTGLIAPTHHLVLNQLSVQVDNVQWPVIPGTFVVPISIRVANGGNLETQYPNPEPRGNSGRAACELVQLDTDFGSAHEDGTTEWIRYNAIVRDMLVRDDPVNLGRVHGYLRFDGADFSQTQIYKWRDPDDNAKSEDQVKDLLDEVNYEVVAEDNGEWGGRNNRLAFRGVFGTNNCGHAAAASVLPVIRFITDAGQNPQTARPGRHDSVTLVSENNQTRDRRIINYAWLKRSEDYGFGTAHVAFTEGVQGTFTRSDRGINFGTNNEEEEIANIVTVTDSRGYTRMLKFPSGELPAQLPTVLNVGADLLGTTAGGDFIDEVRFFSPTDPNPAFAHAQFILRRELRSSEQSTLELREFAIHLPHGNFHRDTLGGFNLMAEIPQDGGLLLIGDEVIAFNERQGSGVIRIAPEGREFFGDGDTPGHHPRDSTVTLLSSIPVSRLTQSINETDGYITLSDASDFPNSGLVSIDRELIIYDRKDGNTLVLAQRPSDRGRSVGEGLFRGRYGTSPSSHDEGTLVILHPVRYWDRYEELAEHSQMASMDFLVPARRGFFRGVHWEEEIPEGRLDLVCYARIDDKSPWDGDPDEERDLLYFEDPESQSSKNWIGRHGDLLQLKFFVRYLDQAYDVDRLSSNAWKQTPRLRWAAVDYLQQTIVERYEESRR